MYNPQQNSSFNKINYAGAFLLIVFSLINIIETLIYMSLPGFSYKLIFILVQVLLPFLLAYGIYKKINFIVGFSFLYSAFFIYHLGLDTINLFSIKINVTFSYICAFVFIFTKLLLIIGTVICLFTLRTQKS